MQKEPLLTATEAASLLRIPAQRVVRLARDAVIPHVVLPGGDIRFEEGDLWRWVEQQKRAELHPGATGIAAPITGRRGTDEH